MKMYTYSYHCDVCGKESKKNYSDKLKIYNKSKIRKILIWFYQQYFFDDEHKDFKIYLCRNCVRNFNKALYQRAINNKGGL